MIRKNLLACRIRTHSSTLRAHTFDTLGNNEMKKIITIINSEASHVYRVYNDSVQLF
jgi:hypothetical protein